VIEGVGGHGGRVSVKCQSEKTAATKARLPSSARKIDPEGHEEATMGNFDNRPRMTREEAEASDRDAFWIGDDEEFMLNGQTKAVSWHAFVEIRPHEPFGVRTSAWEALPPGKQVPTSGWIHWPEK
jgi:hypothetical protein